MAGLEALEDEFSDSVKAAPVAVYVPPSVDRPDPATMTFLPSLPVELAMREQPVRVVCESYGVTREQYEALCDNPRFVKAVEDAHTMLEKEGYSFKFKAGLQAEHMLATSYEMVHNPMVPANVRADLIKATIKWAGLEPKESSNAGGTAFQININL